MSGRSQEGDSSSDTIIHSFLRVHSHLVADAEEQWWCGEVAHSDCTIWGGGSKNKRDYKSMFCANDHQYASLYLLATLHGAVFSTKYHYIWRIASIWNWSEKFRNKKFWVKINHTIRKSMQNNGLPQNRSFRVFRRHFSHRHNGKDWRSSFKKPHWATAVKWVEPMVHRFNEKIIMFLWHI